MPTRKNNPEANANDSGEEPNDEQRGNDLVAESRPASSSSSTAVRRSSRSTRGGSRRAAQPAAAAGNDGSPSEVSAVDSTRKKRRLTSSPLTPPAKRHRGADENPDSEGESDDQPETQQSHSAKAEEQPPKKGDNGNAELNGARLHSEVDESSKETNEKKSQQLEATNASSTNALLNGSHQPVHPSGPSTEAEMKAGDAGESVISGHFPTQQLKQQIQERPQQHKGYETSIPTQETNLHARANRNFADPSIQQPQTEDPSDFIPKPNIPRDGATRATVNPTIEPTFPPTRQQDQAPIPQQLEAINEEPQFFDDEMVEQEEANDVASPRRFSIWRSINFWMFVFFVLQISYLEYWIDPVLQTVVTSSKSLTSFYKERFEAMFPSPQRTESNATINFLDTELPESDTFDIETEYEEISESEADNADQCIVLDTTGDQEGLVETREPKPPRVNITIAEEKRLIRETNEKVALANVEVEQENIRRRELHEQRIEQIRNLRKTNERVEAENRRVLEEITRIEESLRAAENEKHSVDQIMNDLGQEVHAILDDFQKYHGIVQELLPVVAAGHHDKSVDLALMKSIIDEDLEQMSELYEILAAIAESDSFADERSRVDEARALLGESEDFLLDVFSLDLWKPSQATLDCEVQSTFLAESKSGEAAESSALTAAAATEIIENFRLEILQEVEEAQKDESFVEYIESLITAIADEFPLEDLMADAPSLPAPIIATSEGLSVDDIRAIVSSRLQQQEADGTGRIDYVSLLNGAAVLHKATSPSLVDTLPVLNRIGATLSLRFYGYGPEAAFMPTWPVNQLGQCWAFERDDSEGNEDHLRIGRFADLTVQLARPISVESVSIEHPPQEISSIPTTAIKQFQVIGFEEMDASGDPWHLGTFTYDIWDNNKPSRQEFKVAQQVDGQQVPNIGSITLAIDSNWGEAISCLYRFRVHGFAEV